MPLSLRRFAGDRRGSLVIELLLVIPFLVWAILATIVYFYGFEMRNLNLSGAYTVSDLLSREMEGPITPDYIEGIDRVFNYITDTRDDIGRLRVSMIYCAEDCDATDGSRDLKIDWSMGTNGLPDMTEAELDSIAEDAIPVLPLGERLIVVQTQVQYNPPIQFGIDPMTMTTLVVTRPRFVAKLEWDDGTDAGAGQGPSDGSSGESSDDGSGGDWFSGGWSGRRHY